MARFKRLGHGVVHEQRAGEHQSPHATKEVGNVVTRTLRPPLISSKLLLAVVVGLALLAGGLGSYILFASYKPPVPEPRVKVGFMMASTGGSASMGIGAIKGVQLAKEQLKMEVDIVEFDSMCDPKVAVEAYKQLIEQNVIAVIGDGCSSASLAALTEANTSKIPMISPASSSPKLSIPNDYFFRVIPSDNMQGRFLAQAIKEQGYNNVAVFFTNEPYGSSISQVFTSIFKSQGGNVVSTVYADSGTIEVHRQVDEMLASHPDAIVLLPNSATSATAVVSLASRAGYRGAYFGSDAAYDTSAIKDTAGAAEGMQITTFPIGDKDFREALRSRFGTSELSYAAAQSYDAMLAIHAAIDRGAKTGEEVASLLPTIEFQGVSAYIKFDSNGEISDPSYKYDLLKVKDGVFQAE